MSEELPAGIPARPIGEASFEPSTSGRTVVAAQALDALPSRIAVVGPQGTIVAVNRAWRVFAHLHGASDLEACEGRNYFQVCESTDGADRDAAIQVANGLRLVLEGTLPVYEGEHAYTVGDDVCWTSARISPIRDGQVAMAVVAYEDITERKLAEEIVARFVSANPAVIYALGIVDGGFPVRWFSGNLEAMTGWSHEQAQASYWWGHNIHPDDQERVFEANQHAAETDHLVQEFRFRRADGRFFCSRSLAATSIC